MFFSSNIPIRTRGTVTDITAIRSLSDLIPYSYNSANRFDRLHQTRFIDSNPGRVVADIGKQIALP